MNNGEPDDDAFAESLAGGREFKPPFKPPPKGSGIPWDWKPKAAKYKIKKHFQPDEVLSARGVYNALWEIANDEGQWTFTTSIGWIAECASVSTSTVKRRLPELEKLGLVRIERFEPKQNNKYTVILPSPKHKFSGRRPVNIENPDGSR